MSEADVVAISIEQNPTLRSSLLRLESARWDVTTQEANYDPTLLLQGIGQQLSQPGLLNSNRTRSGTLLARVSKPLIWGTLLSVEVSGVYQMLRFQGINTGAPTQTPTNPAMGFRSLTLGPAYLVTTKLSLKQPLLRGRGREVGEAAILNARAQRTEAEHARDRAASELLRDGLTAYWELWYADRALTIQRESREVSAKQRDEARARVETGGLAPADILTFETQVATRDEDIVVAELTRRQRELDLLTKLGVDERPTSLTLADEGIPLGSPPPRELAEQRAISESAELKQLDAGLARVRLQQKTAADPQRAKLDLDSYVQTQGFGNEDLGAAFSQYGKFEAFSAYASLTYEGPLRDRAHRSAAAKARIDVEVAEQTLREARQRVVSEVGKALEAESTAERKLALAEQTRDIAKRQLQAWQERYAAGAAKPIEVLDSENAVRTAELRVARAQADLVQSALTRQHLTGDLVQRYARVTQAR